MQKENKRYVWVRHIFTYIACMLIETYKIQFKIYAYDILKHMQHKATSKEAYNLYTGVPHIFVY